MAEDTPREANPVANLFPLMEGADFEALCEDIRRNGLQEQIWLDAEDRILDGRNRERACAVSATEPRYRIYEGDDPIGFVLSLNLHRRHLTASQRAILALDIERLEAVQAKERQRAAASRGGMASPSDPNKVVEIVPQPSESQTARESAGSRVGVSGRYVQDAKKIAAEAPELVTEVQAGRMTLPEAKKEIRQRERAERVAEIRNTEPTSVDKPPSHFATVVIDPPWQYDNATTRGAAEDHYPTMSVAELAAMDVKSHAADNAHLYLWTTNSFLRDAFDLMEAWGFEYKTLLTWIKPQIGLGNYFRGCTEHVLFGVRGSLATNDRTVRNWFEAPRTRHSEKPPTFYELVERSSPGPYLELFARMPRPGWSSWGNEA